MIGIFLGLAAVIAVGAVAIRRLQERAIERALPGRAPASAIPITNYAEIDVAVRLQACRCGGRFTLVGEGPARYEDRNLRMVSLECRRCERERSLYFDLTELRH